MIAALVLLALAASVYLVYVLEILKFRGVRARQMRTADPATSEHQIDERVQHDIETGEFDQIDDGDAGNDGDDDDDDDDDDDSEADGGRAVG